jgi:hypothetical protein
MGSHSIVASQPGSGDEDSDSTGLAELLPSGGLTKAGQRSVLSEFHASPSLWLFGPDATNLAMLRISVHAIPAASVQLDQPCVMLVNTHNPTLNILKVNTELRNEEHRRFY